MQSLQQADVAAAAVSIATRVSLGDIEATILDRYDITGAEAVRINGVAPNHPLAILSICILVLRNGFVVVGKSAPASPENFNRDLGRQLAYEDAIRQLWPLLGYALRVRLHEDR